MRYEFEDYSNYQLESVIDEWIHGNINRSMMKMKFLDHKTIEDIAEVYNISPITVQRKITKMKSILKRHLVSEKMS